MSWDFVSIIVYSVKEFSKKITESSDKFFRHRDTELYEAAHKISVLNA